MVATNNNNNNNKPIKRTKLWYKLNYVLYEHLYSALEVARNKQHNSNTKLKERAVERLIFLIALTARLIILIAR